MLCIYLHVKGVCFNYFCSSFYINYKKNVYIESEIATGQSF